MDSAHGFTCIVATPRQFVRLLLFGLDSSESYFTRHKAFQGGEIIWWAVMDLNHRIPEETDLQSAAIDRSANYPFFKAFESVLTHLFKVDLDTA